MNQPKYPKKPILLHNQEVKVQYKEQQRKLLGQVLLLVVVCKAWRIAKALIDGYWGVEKDFCPEIETGENSDYSIAITATIV